jgi:transposase
MLSWMKLLWLTAQKRILELEQEIEKLRRENSDLRRDQERLEKEQERLRQERDHLKAELELARRAGKRQAAPFSKGEPEANPKRPGRKGGANYGPKAHRTIPVEVDEEILVPLPDCCPDCGGEIGNLHVEDQYQTEIVRKTHVRRFRVHVGNCVKCGTRVQGRHPLQTSDALGAAASQLGPEALSLAALLNKELGIPFGKSAVVLEKGFGLKVTPSGLCQALARIGKKCKPTYDALVQQVRVSLSVTMDESGWRVGGHSWWLFDAVTPDIVVYGIFPGRGYAEAAVILGEDFSGFLIRDGNRIYLGFKSAYHQSCNGHIINRCKQMIEGASVAAAAFPLKVKGLLQQGLALRDRFAEGEISQHGLAVATGRLEAQLDRLLDQPWRLEENRRLANHLDREFDYLFTYLKCPGLEATNYRAEQAIRPAAVMRKVWGGNRTLNGAHTQQILMSVLRSSRQQGKDSVPLLTDLQRSPRPYVLDIVSAHSPPN